jgi:hypothetical protein
MKCGSIRPVSILKSESKKILLSIIGVPLFVFPINLQASLSLALWLTIL